MHHQQNVSIFHKRRYQACVPPNLSGWNNFGPVGKRTIPRLKTLAKHATEFVNFDGNLNDIIACRRNPL